VPPRFTPFRGGDPIRFVLNANVNRRHLNESQRAIIAAKLATLRNGANQHREEGASTDAPSQNEAAEMLNVGRASVQRARQVLDRAAPADVVAITAGKATVSAVAKKIKPPTQKAIVKASPVPAAVDAVEADGADTVVRTLCSDSMAKLGDKIKPLIRDLMREGRRRMMSQRTDADRSLLLEQLLIEAGILPENKRYLKWKDTQAGSNSTNTQSAGTPN
jgi:hypothetical protein